MVFTRNRDEMLASWYVYFLYLRKLTHFHLSYELEVCGVSTTLTQINIYKKNGKDICIQVKGGI